MTRISTLASLRGRIERIRRPVMRMRFTRWRSAMRRPMRRCAAGSPVPRCMKSSPKEVRALQQRDLSGDDQPGGDVKVMDFGIARAMADSAATMTQTAQVIGTAQYLSPEQARGERVDARSDIYSTGCVLYELLTGQPPFTGDSPVAIAYQHVREEPIPPSQIDPEIPKWADAIVLKAMAKDPAHRYQNAGEMRADIQRAMSGMPMDAQTMAMASNYGRATRTMRQRPRPPAARPPSAPAPSRRTSTDGGRRAWRRRPAAAAAGGGNTAVKTAAWIIIPLLVIGAFIGVGYLFLSGAATPS